MKKDFEILEKIIKKKFSRNHWIPPTNAKT